MMPIAALIYLSYSHVIIINPRLVYKYNSILQNICQANHNVQNESSMMPLVLTLNASRI